MQGLESLLEKKQTPKKAKKCILASQGKSLSKSLNTETFPVRKQLASPKREKIPLVLKAQRGQKPRKPPVARGLLTGVCFELLNTFLSVNLPPAVQCFEVFGIVGQKCVTAHM